MERLKKPETIDVNEDTTEVHTTSTFKKRRKNKSKEK